MKRFVLAAVIGLFSVVALAAQSGQGFTATVNVGAGIGTVQSPDVFLSGDEVIVSMPYDSKGTWDCSVFSPPNGDAFKILARGGMQAGKGTLLFGIPSASFSKVFEITAMLDFNSQRGTVYIQLKNGVTGLRKAAVPAALASQVIRAGAPQVAQVAQASEATKPPFIASANVPTDMATLGTMVMFSTGTEAVFSIPYDSKGDWDVSFFNPPNGDRFQVVAAKAIKTGKGTLTFALPLGKLAGVTEAVCLVDYSGRRASVLFSIQQDPASLKPSSIPAELAAGVIRKSTVVQVQQQAQTQEGASTPYSVRVRVPEEIAEIGEPEMYFTGTEVVFSIPYDSTGSWITGFFDAPAGKSFNITAFGAMKKGKGTLAFAVSPDQLTGVGEVSVTLFRGATSGFVTFRINQDPKNMTPTAIPPELAEKVLRMSPKTANQSSDPSSPFLDEMPPELATMGTPSLFSTGKEVIFSFPYDSVGTWDVSFGNPSEGFSMSANSAMKKGKGELVFGVPISKLTNLGQIFVMVRTPRLGGDFTVDLGKVLPTLRVTKVPTNIASKAIRATTKQPRSYDKPILTPEQANWTAFDDLPATKEGAMNRVGKNLDARLVGRWRDEFTEAQRVFYPDGTAMYIAPYYVAQDKIVWSTRGDKVLIQTNNSEGGGGEPDEMPYTLKDGHLFFGDISTSLSGEKEKIIHGYVPFP